MPLRAKRSGRPSEGFDASRTTGSGSGSGSTPNVAFFHLGLIVLGLALVDLLGPYHGAGSDVSVAELPPLNASDWIANRLNRAGAIPESLVRGTTKLHWADLLLPSLFLAYGALMRAGVRGSGSSRSVGTISGGSLRTWGGLAAGLLLIGLVFVAPELGYANWSGLRRDGPIGVIESHLLRGPTPLAIQLGLTGLWVLPVIGANAWLRLAWIVVSGLAFLGLGAAGYPDWVADRGLNDGGPLGFLAWTLPMLVGSLALDIVHDGTRGLPLAALGFWSLILMALGIGADTLTQGVDWERLGSSLRGWETAPITNATAETPAISWLDGQDVPWRSLNPRSAAMAYQCLGAGFGLAAFAACLLMAELLGRFVEPLGMLGRRAVIAYVLHRPIASTMDAWVPPDSPLWYVLLGATVALTVLLLGVRAVDTMARISTSR